MNLKNNLQHKGAIEYDLKGKIFNADEIRNLEKEIFQQKESFEVVEQGDTEESSSLCVLRIKRPNVDSYNAKKVRNFLEKKEFVSFLKDKTELENIEIDRCQAHIYQKGDFLSLHNDTDSCPDYKYSCILFFSDDYEGAEFKVYSERNSHSFKPKYGEILLIKSGLMHEVCKVRNGTRKVLVFFIK